MEILEIKEQDDGSAIYVFDSSSDEYSVFFRAGLKQVADEYKPDSFEVLPPSMASGDEKRVELDDDVADWLVGIAIISTFKQAIEKEKSD